MQNRLSRKEQQARTRSGLIASAAKIFCRRGLGQASIDEVAEHAGVTKGAFYANFKSKQELFLAILDERFADRLRLIERVLASDATPEEQARQGGAEFVRWSAADPEWERLFFEFAVHALRDEDFRQELVTRYQALRERITELYTERAHKLGVESPVPLDQVAVMTFAMANGTALEKLLEPEAVPDDLHPTMMALFFSGLRTASDQGSVRAPASGP